MDSTGCPENSLPGMGIPRWMKRATERSNYADICASPPSQEDGFFHINRQRFETAVNNSDGQPNVECYQNQKKKSAQRNESTPEMFPSSATVEFPTNESHHFGRGTSIILTNKDCAALKETSNFYKSIATTSASSLVNLAMASQEGSMSRTMGISEITSLSGNTNPSFPAQIEIQKGTTTKRAPALDSAVSSDDVSSLAIVLTKPNSNHEVNELSITQQLVAKTNGIVLFQPPDDTTPSSTPSATPTCSPQVSRRTGNPFFTGSQDKSSSGNWLFRSSSTGLTSNKGDKGQDSRNPMYETRVEMTRPLSAGPGPGVPSQQKVRYVPRPSELRELNFWSPTSM